MKTTFEPPADLIPGRIAHVVYRVVGQAAERFVTSGVDENVSNAVRRDLFVAIETLAHELRGVRDRSTREQLASTIMHLAADISMSAEAD